MAKKRPAYNVKMREMTKEEEKECDKKIALESAKLLIKFMEKERNEKLVKDEE